MDGNLPPVNLYKTPEGYQQVVDLYDRTLHSWGLPYQSRFVETKFGVTHVVVCGRQDGKPVVLFHGQNANASSAVKWVPPLAEKFRIFAVDTIGGMGKSAGVRLRTRNNDFGYWAAEVIQNLRLSKANLIGVSFGGWLIMKLAQVAPDVIGSAALLSSAGFLRISFSLVIKMVQQSIGADQQEIIRSLSALIYAPDQVPDPFYVEFLAMVLKSGFQPEPFATRLTGRAISQLTAPAQVLMGEHENSFDPHRALKRAERFLPDLRSAEIIPGVGHSLDHSDPLIVISRVIDFIDHYGAAR